MAINSFAYGLVDGVKTPLNLATSIEQVAGLVDALAKCVEKVDGKGLSTNDLTNVLLTKLNGLENYDDTSLSNSISSLTTRLDTLVNGSASTAIDTFNEIVAFLRTIDDTTTLEGIIAGINTTIAQESSRAIAAENSLQQNINTEKSSRESADTTLQNNINAESTSRQNADTTLQTNITNEINRAKLAEVNLCNDINVDKIYPLGSGYYTLSTAIAAVSTQLRSVNAKITFKSEANTVEEWVYTGTDISGWLTASNWKNKYSDFIQLGADLNQRIDGYVSKSYTEKMQGITKVVVSPLRLCKKNIYKVTITADSNVTIPEDGFALQLKDLDTNINLESINFSQMVWDGSEKSVIYKADKDYNNVGICQYSTGLITESNVSYKISNITAESIQSIDILQSINEKDAQRTEILLDGNSTDIFSGYQFLGGLNYNTVIDSPVNRSYYISTGSGIYTYCDNIEIKEGEAAFLLYNNGYWNKISTTIATLEKIDSIAGASDFIKNVIEGVYVIGNTHNVQINTVAFKVNAYGTDSLGINVRYINEDGSIINGTEDSLFATNMSNFNPGQLIKMQNFNEYTTGKATDNVNYYIRLSDSLNWSSVTEATYTTSIKITRIGEGNNVLPFIDNLKYQYNLDNLSYTILSTPTNSRYYYGLFSEIFVTGVNSNYDIIVTYLGFNHSAFGDTNYLGFQLGYLIDGKICTLSNFSIDAHNWGPDELHEIPNYYSNAMEANGVKLFVRTSNNYKWDSSVFLFSGNLLKLQKNRVNISPDSFTAITVGTGQDFTTLRGALEFVNGKASSTNKFKIIVYKGTYELSSEYSEMEMKVLNFKGYVIPDYVSVVGDNSNGDVIISAMLSDELAGYDRGGGQLCGVYMSVLNVSNTSCMENLIVIANNIKYPIHDDWATTSLDRIIKNCTFHHLGGTGIDHGYCHAYGGGCRSKGNFYYENCKFTSEVGYGYLMHSNTNWNAITLLRFKNCVFESFNSESKAVSIQSLGNGLSVKSPVFFENCSFTNNGLEVTDSSVGNIGWDWTVSGVGNNKPTIYAHSDETTQEHYVAMIDETKTFKADGEVIQFSPICLNGSTKAKSMSSENIALFYGIALTNANDGENVIIKYDGYMHKSELKLLNINLGDRVSVSNGAFILTTGDDYIGICDTVDYIRLI